MRLRQPLHRNHRLLQPALRQQLAPAQRAGEELGQVSGLLKTMAVSLSKIVTVRVNYIVDPILKKKLEKPNEVNDIILSFLAE